MRSSVIPIKPVVNFPSALPSLSAAASAVQKINPIRRVSQKQIKAPQRWQDVRAIAKVNRVRPNRYFFVVHAQKSPREAGWVGCGS